MRKSVLSLIVLAGLTAAGAVTQASAAPVIAVPAASGAVVTGDAAIQNVDWYDARFHRWHRHEEWRRREEWRRHHWHYYHGY